jgi:hypothetical protein
VVFQRIGSWVRVPAWPPGLLASDQPQNPAGVTLTRRKRWRLKHLEKTNPQSLLQYCLREIKMRQGTTSVVPQMANLDSGFSRCGIANY